MSCSEMLIVDAIDSRSKKISIGELSSVIIEAAQFTRCGYCGQRNHYFREDCNFCGGRL